MFHYTYSSQNTLGQACITPGLNNVGKEAQRNSEACPSSQGVMDLSSSPGLSLLTVSLN